MSLASIIQGTSGLKSYWKCDEAVGASTCIDSISGHNGTIGSASKAGAAGFDNQLNKALRCDGTGSGLNGVSVANHADFNSTTLTFECCFRLVQHVRGINAGFYAKGSSWYFFYLSQQGNNGFYPEISDNATGVIQTGSVLVADTHLWHHIMFTAGGASTTTKIYLDGIDISGSATSRTITANSSAAGFGTDYQKFAMNNVAYYSTQLVVADAQARFAALQQERNPSRTAVYFGAHCDAMYTGTNGEIDSQIASVASIGAKVTRHTLRWPIVQTTNGGAYDWSVSDEIVRICNLNKVIPWFIFATTPTWANGGTGVWDIPGTGVDATYTTFVTKCETFVTDFVNRYKPGGSGTYTIPNPFYLEIWNEPNLNGFWNNTAALGANADQYAYMYRRIRTVAIAAYPAIKCVFGGLSSWSGAGAGIAGEDYFPSVIGSSQWSSSPIDYMAYHPYSAADNPDDIVPFENHFNDVMDVKDVLCVNGYGTAPLMLSEFGAVDTTSRADQANKLDRMFRRIRDEWQSMCPVAIWFRDNAQYSSGEFGLFANNPSDGSVSKAPKTAASIFMQYASLADSARGAHVTRPM